MQSWPGLSSQGLCLCRSRHGKRERNTQPKASMVDSSNFLSFRFMAMSPSFLAGHAIFKPSWKTSGSMLGCGSSEEVSGGLLIQLSQLGANRVTYQSYLPLTGRKWSEVNMKMIPRTLRGYTYALTSGHRQPSGAVESRAIGPG